jgi:hypothetical protein
MDNVKDKIRKLLAMGQSPNENEAAVAMSKAAELMMRHNLTENDVSERLVGYGREIDTEEKRYRQIIGTAIGEMFSTIAIFRTREQKMFTFVGRESNVAASEDMYHFIVDQLEASYKQFLPKGMSKAERADYRRTFKWSMAVRIAHRIIAISEEIASGTTQAGANALVIVAKKEQLQAEAKAFIGPMKEEARTITQKPGRGTFEGMMAGDTVQLQKTVK